MSVYYLKYRPQKVSHLDLKEVREIVSKILASTKIPHAFLFSGPKGLGKTSTARIVAKSINCQRKKPADFEPCNKCLVCQNIIQGRSLDFIEIDAASNRGIDDIRELKEKIKLAPALAKKKVYVIDEVHMLTTEAFNALLKTLEEPPEHAIFILCTTEPQKLPATIISRCQQINFRQPSLKEIKRALLRIIKAEKIKIADLSLEIISRYASNSFRDAVKNLEMLVSLYGKKINQKQVKEYFSQPAGQANFFSFLKQKKTTAALKWLNHSLAEGVDPKSLTIVILEALRKILLAKFGVLEEKVDDFGFSSKEVKKLIFLFDQAGQQVKNMVIPQLALELAVCQWGETKNKEQKADNKKLIQGKENFPEWEKVLKEVKKENPSLEALLKAAKPVKLAAGVLTVEVFYPFHQERLTSSKYVKIMEEKLKTAYKVPVKVKYFLNQAKG